MAQRTEEPPISWLMKLTLERPELISLAAGFTDDETLPVSESARLLARLFKDKKRGRKALQYGPAAGDPNLRRLTAARLARMDHLSSSDRLAPRVLLTHGSQQLLYLLTEALCDEGDIVLLEDPTYFVYLGIVQSRGLQCRGISMEPDGINGSHLEEVLAELARTGRIKKVKMLYLVTYYQNPTGITTSLKKKGEALRILKKFERQAGHPIYLLEDAAYRELRFEGEPVPSALQVDSSPEGRVLYTGTYSKPFATGIRVGFGVLPEPVLTAVLRLKGNHDFGTASLLQQILSEAIRTKVYDEHLQILQTRYRKKAQRMVQAIETFFPTTVKWRHPQGGLYVWATFPEKIKTGLTSKIFQEGLEAGVIYVPGELCYGPDPGRKIPRNQARISFGGVPLAQIFPGIEKLSKAIDGGK